MMMMQRPEEILLRFAVAHQTEATALVVFILYMVALAFGLAGKERKRGLLRRSIIPALQQQFSSVVEAKGDGLNELACYATGRRGCRSATGKVKLKNSQDLFSFLVLDRIFKNEHRFVLAIDFVLGELTCPFVYAVAHADILKWFLACSPDVRAYTQKMPLEYLPKMLNCYTENKECVVLTQRMIQALRQSESIFRYLHISDQLDLFDMDPPERGIRLCTRLPKTLEETVALEELILATCEIVDVLVSETVFPTEEARNAAVQARMKVHASLSRSPMAPVVSSLTLHQAQQFLLRQQQELERRYAKIVGTVSGAPALRDPLDGDETNPGAKKTN